MTDKKRMASRHPVTAALGVSLAVGLAFIGLRYAGALQRLEHIVYDVSFRLSRPAETDRRFLIVAVDEADIRRFDWPLTDGDLAQAIALIRDGGARAIGVDIYRDIPQPPGTESLARVLADTPHAVMVRLVGDGDGDSIPAPSSLNGAQVGFNDLVIDPDGVLRRGLVYLNEEDGEVAYSLSFLLAHHYLAESGVALGGDPSDPNQLRLGPTTIPPFHAYDGGYVAADDAGYQYLLDFAGAPTEFESVTLTDLLGGRVDPERFRDRIVLIGLAAVSTNDFFHLPFLPDVAQGVRNAGVAVHSHMASQLVRYGLGESTPLVTFGEWQEVALILTLAVLGGAIGLWTRSVVTFVLTATTGLLCLWGAAAGLFRAGFWLPIVPPGFAWFSSAAVVAAYMSSHEKRQRELIMHLFSRHVSPKIAEDVWRRQDEFLEGGRPRSSRLVATVMFLDMKGYTSRAEKMAPEDLMAWVNEFMEVMAHGVMKHGGFVDDYFGDGMKVDFGVPFPRTSEEEIREDALSAITCALDLEQTLHRLNADWKNRDLPTVGMRIGIATGIAVAGSLGDEERLKYTVVGDVVQTAQRLEALDHSDHDFEREPCRILISDQTQGYVGSRIPTRKVGEFRLKGKGEPVVVHRVALADGRMPDVDGRMPDVSAPGAKGGQSS